ncbi:hypothetical protein GC175_21705 [bacterium]|nr:hypothetical protein [bacterium]
MNQSTASEKKEAVDSHEEPPKLEFARSSESLEAFGAALGGAVLGVLATLLILAIINNGTLRFTGAGGESLRASITRMDENLGAVSHNIDVVAERLAAIEGESGALGQVQSSLSSLDASLIALDEQVMAQGIAMEELEVTRRNFDTFTAALAQALGEMNTMQSAQAEAAAPMEAVAVEAPAAEAATTEAPAAEVAEAVAMPMVVSEAALAANSVAAYLFVDNNADGMLNDDEAALIGATFTLTPAEGEAVTGQTTDAGALFAELAAGEYTVTVEDALGFSLISDSTATVTVSEDAAEGQAVFFPVAAGE